MIHAALWILAACIVVPVVLTFGASILWLLFGGGRWVYTGLVLLIAFVWIGNTISEQNQKSETRRSQNAPLQEQCIQRAYSEKSRWDNDPQRFSVSNYEYKANSALRANINICRNQYPTY